jgi:hypothetical protein
MITEKKYGKYTSDDTSVTVTTVADKEDYNTGVNLTYQFK